MLLSLAPMQPNSHNQELRVALLTDADVFAGTERHMLDLARSLRETRASVTLACPAPSPLAEAAQADGFSILAIPKQGLIDRNAVRILRRVLQEGSVDIIHAHNGRTALLAALAVSAAGRGQCLMTQHFLEPNHATLSGPRAWLSHAAHWWVVGRMFRILAISQSVRQAMLERGEAPDAKIVVVPNGITPPSVADPNPVRAALGIAADAPLVACVARLEQEKDVASLVQAMGEVLRQMPRACCLIAGDGAQREALAAQIARLGLEQNVFLLGFRQDAGNVMAAADLFVLPSLAEPFGLVILEAMALGKAVVATQAGGPLEIVVPGKTGLLVTPAAPHALAQAILQLLRDPDLRSAMGHQGQARYVAKFTAARMAQQTLAVYREAAGRPVAPSSSAPPVPAPPVVPDPKQY